MKTRREDGTVTDDAGWTEISMGILEFGAVMLFAAIGLIALLDFLSHHH
jgi:hypothetical protein